MTELSIIDALNMLIREWRSLTKPRQRDLLRICNQKYEQMRANHAEFESLFLNAKDLASKVIDRRRFDIDELASEIKILGRRRLEGRSERLAQYEQAKVYLEDEFTNGGSILRKIPRPVMLAVKDFMQSYASYYEREGTYQHDAELALHKLHDILSKYRVASHEGKLEFVDQLESWMAFLEQCLLRSELLWMKVSRDYFRAYAKFADHGIFLESAPDD